MKKASIGDICKSIFWYILLLLPLLIILFTFISSSMSYDDGGLMTVAYNFLDNLPSSFLDGWQDSVIYTGVVHPIYNYFVPSTSSTGHFMEFYLVYFILCVFFRIVIEVVLFIPTVLSNVFDGFKNDSKKEF